MANLSTRDIKPPYLLFLGDATPEGGAKSAQGIAHWRPELCVGENRMPGCGVTVGLESLSIEEAAERGAKTLIVGITSIGGHILDKWMPSFRRALELGMDIVSGMHDRLTDIPDLVALADKHGQKLHDVRHPVGPIPVGTGEKRTGKRCLTVGTDCAVGKMFTAFALEREMKNRQMPVTLCTTGQTGIMASGQGIAIDAVVADFISGAVEALAPAADDDHWQVIEGQGSLFHPGFSGVTMGLVHGSQADAMVLCHEPTRQFMKGTQYPLPSIADCIPVYESTARLTNPQAKIIGIAVNTRNLSDTEAETLLAKTAEETGLPVVDPVRTGVGPLVDVLATL